MRHKSHCVIDLTVRVLAVESPKLLEAAYSSADAGTSLDDDRHLASQNQVKYLSPVRPSRQRTRKEMHRMRSHRRSPRRKIRTSISVTCLVPPDKLKSVTPISEPLRALDTSSEISDTDSDFSLSSEGYAAPQWVTPRNWLRPLKSSSYTKISRHNSSYISSSSSSSSSNSSSSSSSNCSSSTIQDMPSNPMTSRIGQLFRRSSAAQRIHNNNVDNTAVTANGDIVLDSQLPAPAAASDNIKPDLIAARETAEQLPALPPAQKQQQQQQKLYTRSTDSGEESTNMSYVKVPTHIGSPLQLEADCATLDDQCKSTARPAPIVTAPIAPPRQESRQEVSKPDFIRATTTKSASPSESSQPAAHRNAIVGGIDVPEPSDRSQFIVTLNRLRQLISDQRRNPLAPTLIAPTAQWPVNLTDEYSLPKFSDKVAAAANSSRSKASETAPKTKLKESVRSSRAAIQSLLSLPKWQDNLAITKVQTDQPRATLETKSHEADQMPLKTAKSKKLREKKQKQPARQLTMSLWKPRTIFQQVQEEQQQNLTMQKKKNKTKKIKKTLASSSPALTDSSVSRKLPAAAASGPRTKRVNLNNSNSRKYLNANTTANSKTVSSAKQASSTKFVKFFGPMFM